jgi:XTP/dITP diphosphohydrolase
MSAHRILNKSDSDGKLVVASHNVGKVREINELLAAFGITPISAGDLGLDEPEETGTTFIANAELKALAAAKASGLTALADDSGFAVEALNGDPGIYSSRWAGPSKNFSVAMEKVEQAWQDTGSTNRSAHFVCALSLAWPDGHCETFEGKVFGEMIWPPRGKKGFGYDPVFIPRGHNISFAEMEPQAKYSMSHRANAFNQLIAACFRQNNG